MKKGENRLFDKQKDFSISHKYVLVFMCIYVMERFSNNMGMSIVTPLATLGIWFLMDKFLVSHDFFNSSTLATVFRYLQLLTVTIFTVCTSDVYSVVVLVVCLLVSIIEFFALFDFTEAYYRTVGFVSLGIDLLIGLITHMLFFPSDVDHMFAMAFALVLILVVAVSLGLLFTKFITEYDNEIFSQSRLISNVNKINEELRLNQDKVKATNEQLGLQKIQLEAAYKKINCVNSEVTIQNEIVKYISSSLEVEKIMSLITEAILEGMGLNICAMILYEDEVSNPKIKYKIKSSFNEQFIENFGNSIEHGRLNDYLDLTDTYVDNRVNDMVYPFLQKENIGSILIVPLNRQNKQIGALFVGHRKYEYFTENKSFFEAIVAQFLIALDNATLYQKMEYLATRDGLTGIYNRGNLTKFFNEFLNDSIINKTSLTVALFDIDKFKNVNDTYGHLFGDEVIKTIASLANNIAEENHGIVGRYGGEEFVIIFPNKGLNDAYPAVKKMHQQVKEKELFHNGQSVFVKVSVGITSYPETCKNPGDLLNRADWAMYYSKQNGRDRITIDSDEIRESVMIK